MIISQNNLIVKLDQQDPVEYAILNPVSGSFDIMSESEREAYSALESGKTIHSEMMDYLIDRGYLFKDLQEHERTREDSYREFLHAMKEEPVQLILIPSYSRSPDCACSPNNSGERADFIFAETVDSFFNYIEKEFGNAKSKPFITLFGSEPLINSKAQKEMVDYIVNQCAEKGYEFSAVTNGCDFTEYAEMLKKAKIKEIQFALDGTQTLRGQEGWTANQKGCFGRILDGIEQAVLHKMPVKLKVVIERQNFRDLVNLAEQLDQRGWLDLPAELFKTEIRADGELCEWYERPESLFSQLELWTCAAKLAEEYPVIKKFHRPDFMGVRSLVDTEELRPVFYTCPAAKTRWVFDLYGDIYGCTACCGREKYKLGTYWPIVKRNEAAMQSWQKRDATNIEPCRSCKFDVICGGGCGAAAAEKNGGEILSPDCRPVRKIYAAGLNFYRDEIAIYEEKEIFKNTSCEKAEVRSGCILCGDPLRYFGFAEEHICNICGKVFLSNISCPHGHYVCDHCHSGDVLDHMEDLLIASSEKNPIRLAEMIFSLPTMKIHGPEHHSMVPAVLETAHQNIKGIRDVGKIKEAIKRGKDTKGGSCGFHGNCGACVGTGIAESIYLGATPKSREERGRAMLATSKALAAVSELGGPLCCKRDSITSIRTYMDLSGRYKGVDEYQYHCRFFRDNPDCLAFDCPYFPIQQKEPL